MDDTPLEIKKKVHDMLQKKSPLERVEMGCSMYETSKYLITQAILEQNPGISKKDLRKEIFLRFYRDDFTPSQLEKILKHLENNT